MSTLLRPPPPGLLRALLSPVKVVVPALALLLATAPSGKAQPLRTGPETPIDWASLSDTSRAAIAAGAGGQFVVSWGSQAGSGFYNIRTQRFDHTGLALEPGFQVNPATVLATSAPSVAAAPDGSFIVVWPGLGPNCDRECVFAQRYDSNGASTGSIFQVNSYTTFYQTKPVIAADASGDFVVVWQSRDFELAGQDGSTWGVFAQRYDSSGSPLGSEFQVNAYTTGPQSQPSVAMDGAGNFVVTWHGYIDTCADRCVFLRRFDAGGMPLGSEFIVNRSTSDARIDAAVASNSAGHFLVTWTSYGGSDGDRSGVFARLFDATAAPLSDEFQVNVRTSGDQGVSKPIMYDDGSFAIVWQSDSHQDGSGEGVFARRFDAAATPTTDELAVNTFRALDQGLPSIAAQDTGDFVVAWKGPGQYNTGLFVQRFCDQASTACDRCPGFDDALDADLDGIPDGCDPCTNIGGVSNFSSKRRFSAKNKGCSDCPDHKFMLRGSFTVPPARPFASLDPGSDGARVIVSTASGYTMAEVVLPAGMFTGSGSAGWTVNGAGTNWKFRDKTTSPGHGRFSLRLRDAAAKLPGLVKVAIKARDFAFPAQPGDTPISAVVVLGTTAEAIEGACGEVAFTPEKCAFTSNARRLSCK